MSAGTLRHPEFILLSARGFLDPTQELGCEGLWQRDSVFLEGELWSQAFDERIGRRKDQ